MNANARSAYLDASIATASPARLLVMLCDRLVLDLQRGLAAQERGDIATTNSQLLHAQDIVLELRSSLKVDAWSGGATLASLYDFLHTSLVQANIRRDAALTATCLGLATDLGASWRDAALHTAAAV